MEQEVKCPKCGSNQITANRKGFSGKKAVAGAVLTGGIGVLAGTIGSKKVVITCLNCGNEFKPGEGSKPTVDVPKQDNDLDQRLIEMCANGRMLAAVEMYKRAQNVNLAVAKTYVENLMRRNNMQVPASGCASVILIFILSSLALIATAHHFLH